MAERRRVAISSTPSTPALDCSPERLMQLVREGDGRLGALDQITRCYSQRLLEAGRRHCRTHAEAEDAVQNALVTMTEHVSELREDAKLEGWLIRVVASACRRLGRGLKNDSGGHDADAVGALDADPSRDPEAETARLELARRLERELLELSPRDRSILLLAELEDFSSAEIGAELGMSDGAVRTQLSRLRQRLAAALDEKSTPAM